jgi:hypothetical protein
MANVTIYPPVEQYGTLEFTALEAIVDLAYKDTQKKVEVWRAAGKLDLFFNH